MGGWEGRGFVDLLGWEGIDGFGGGGFYLEENYGILLRRDRCGLNGVLCGNENCNFGELYFNY